MPKTSEQKQTPRHKWNGNDLTLDGQKKRSRDFKDAWGRFMTLHTENKVTSILSCQLVIERHLEYNLLKDKGNTCTYVVKSCLEGSDEHVQNLYDWIASTNFYAAHTKVESLEEFKKCIAIFKHCKTVLEELVFMKVVRKHWTGYYRNKKNEINTAFVQAMKERIEQPVNTEKCSQ